MRTTYHLPDLRSPIIVKSSEKAKIKAAESKKVVDENKPEMPVRDAVKFDFYKMRKGQSFYLNKSEKEFDKALFSAKESMREKNRKYRVLFACIEHELSFEFFRIA